MTESEGRLEVGEEMRKDEEIRVAITGSSWRLFIFGRKRG